VVRPCSFGAFENHIIVRVFLDDLQPFRRGHEIREARYLLPDLMEQLARQAELLPEQPYRLGADFSRYV
jgi:hypothetical protein